jgi:hypothetical protein
LLSYSHYGHTVLNKEHYIQYICIYFSNHYSLLTHLHLSPLLLFRRSYLRIETFLTKIQIFKGLSPKILGYTFSTVKYRSKNWRLCVVRSAKKRCRRCILGLMFSAHSRLKPPVLKRCTAQQLLQYFSGRGFVPSLNYSYLKLTAYIKLKIQRRHLFSDLTI